MKKSMNRKKRLAKKHNKMTIKKMGIKKDISNITDKIKSIEKSGQKLTDEEFSNLISDFGEAIVKGLIPNAKTVVKPTNTPKMRTFIVNNNGEETK